jgi:hypothetical protein
MGSLLAERVAIEWEEMGYPAPKVLGLTVTMVTMAMKVLRVEGLNW